MMDINTDNLINKSLINNYKKFDNIQTKNMEDKQLKKVSDEFEAFFLKQIMDTSLKTVNIAGEATGSDIIKGMYTQGISDASAGTLGISGMLYEYLSQQNKK